MLLVELFVRAVARRHGREALQQPWAAWGLLWIVRSTSLLVLLLLAGAALGGDAVELPRETASLSPGQLHSWLVEEHATLGRLQDVLVATLLFGALQGVLLGRIVPVRQPPKPAATG